MAKPAMIGEKAGKRFASKLSELFDSECSVETNAQALCELMLGYAAGNLMGHGASKDDVRGVLEGMLQLMPDAPERKG